MTQKYAADGLCEFCEQYMIRSIVEIKKKQYKVCKICAGGVVGTKAGVVITKQVDQYLRHTQ